MGKKIIYGVTGIVIVVVVGAGAYLAVSYLFSQKKVPPPPKKDLTEIVVAPVSFPLKGYQLRVPTTPEQVVELDLVSPSAKRDYPMARFTNASTSKDSTLTAYDDLVSEEVAGWRAVPIAVTELGATSTWYIARLQKTGETWTHIDSIYLGDDLTMTGVKVTGENVAVGYLVHDRNQERTEAPRVSTTAIISLPTGTLIQAGRNPKTEAVIAYKTFAGEYLWVNTKTTDGSITIPNTPDRFSLRFNGNRIELGTDCNSGSATFATEPLPATMFTVEQIATTKMFCESAQEADYFAMVQAITNYEEVKGDLLFTLADGAQMTFTPKQRALQFESTESAPVEEVPPKEAP